MRCPRCGHDNPEQARFCNQCAQALLPGAAVPKYLAEKIIASRSALEGERKQITVLFADMKGSMELLAGRDPEEARKILDPMLELMMDAVHQYEGTVNQVMGDGIMALFGAPIAHEDHAVRACWAALRMQAAVARHSETLQRAGAMPVQIRVGVNSGEVVVRSISGDLHMDYTAVGQTTHLAARMEQLASPGSILVTAETLRLAQGTMQAKPLGPMVVAGLREPVNAYQLVGAGKARSRLQAAATRGLGRFVGRDDEMGVLASALDVAGRGQGQIVTVVGEAGVGKSRLLHEFVHGSGTQGWLVLETGCVSYGRAKGFLPIIDLLKTYFAIEERDDSRRVRERVASKLLALDRSLEPALPALWAMLDALPEASPWQRLDPGQRRRAILDALKRLVLRECQVQPVILVFEDLHWVDAESGAVLDALAEALSDAKLLLLASCRPEARHPWGSTYRQLHLDPLPRASAEELLDALLGQTNELHDLRQQLIARTQGNPFFIEECISALAETGALAGGQGAYRLDRAVESLKVPATVQAILAARIDRLAPDDQLLLQAAAVVGKDVPFALLQSIAGLADDALRSTLGRLQAAELLYEAARFPDLEYTFKHALTHEVSYASLLGERRRELHARVVAAIEARYRDRIGEHTEWLAHHAARGGLNGKAVAYLNDAGTKAVMRSAHREAIGFFEEALTLVAGLPETRETLASTLELLTGLGPALMATKGGWDRDVEACYVKALDLCDRLGETLHRFPVLFGLWGCHYSRGEHERARELATALLRVAGDGDETMRLEARHSLWSTAIAVGRPAEALPHLEQGQLLYRQHERSAWWIYGTHDPGVCCHQMGAIGAWLLGNFDQARDAAVRGVQLARQVRHSGTTVLAHQLAAVVYYHRGERGAATLHAKAASSLGRAYGVMGWPEHASIILARLLVEEGSTDEAIRLAEANLPGALRAGWPWSASISFGLVADIYGQTDQPAKGLDMLRSLEPKQYEGLYGPELHRLYARLLLAVAPLATDEAEARLRAAVALARERQMKSLELRVAMSLAYLLAPRDRRAARAALSVVGYFSEGSEVADLRTARALRHWLE
jgi:class 3 adenylate cyclase/tetratricopeptide (TPR) repeat protein